MSDPAMPPEGFVRKPSATEQALVDVLDAILDCDTCQRHPESMREHVKYLRAFYSHDDRDVRVAGTLAPCTVTQ